MYDIIGDIHGHADALAELLHKLGYREQAGVFRHPERKVIFCGDFIDRGPRIRDVITIARSMWEAEAALAVMGNHEFNALAFHTPKRNAAGDFLRARTDKNFHQHQATLEQLGEFELKASLDWFRQLPISLDLGELRVVHACWDPEELSTAHRTADEHGYMSDEFLHCATDRKHPVFESIERLMKGPEMTLPPGCVIADKEGNRRRRARIRWFESPDGHSCASYSMPAVKDPALLSHPVPSDARPAVYSVKEPPVFIGHYWLSGLQPAPLAANIACVDYSIAKGGMLVAYRHTGEKILKPDHFVCVPTRSKQLPVAE